MSLASKRAQKIQSQSDGEICYIWDFILAMYSLPSHTLHGSTAGHYPIQGVYMATAL